VGYYGRGDSNCYGRGDYYRGDYYRGDPGFLGNLARGALNIAKRVLPVVAPVVGGVIGEVAGRLARRRVEEFVAPPLPQLSPGGQLNVNGSAGAAGTSVVQSPAGRYAPPWGLTVMGGPEGVSVCGIKGTHINKSGYYRRTPGGGVAYIEPKSACVPNRRMNPCNGRALRRALRRAAAFKRVAMRSINVLSPAGKKKRFGGFKVGRRKRA
jgi:hypothetical protein